MERGILCRGGGTCGERGRGKGAVCDLGVMAGVPGAVPDDHAEGGGEVDAQAPGLG